jgi:hypothetical protein
MNSVRTKPHAKTRLRWLPASTPTPFNACAPVLCFCSVIVLCGSAYPANGAQPIAPVVIGPAIVIGFVGGHVHHDDLRHAEVQLADKLGAKYGKGAHIGIYENRRQEDARRSVLTWLDNDNDGNLSDAEKRQAHIILYGHSWGASAVVALARKLQKDQIPVLLTIQVDSITKLGEDDQVIPANVARAVNFYQTGGALHGLSKIVPADPLRTQILGDFRLDYKRQPEPCSVYPWFARHFMKGHTSIECDPKVWSRIESLIDEYLLSSDTKAQSTISRNF